MRKAEVEQREFHSAQGVAVVSVHLPFVGTLMEQHQHDISHVTFVASGAVVPIVDGESLPQLKTGQAMEVEAFKTHCFLTTEPNTRLLCITNTIGKLVPAEGPRVLPKEFQIGE